MGTNPFISNQRLTVPFFFLPSDRSIMCVKLRQEDRKHFEEVFSRNGSQVLWDEHTAVNKNVRLTEGFTDEDIVFLKSNGIKL